MTTRYFADIGLDRTVDNPYFLWRWKDEPHFSTERYDRPTRRWVSDPSLAAYIMHGEIGSEEISKKKAMEIIRRWERSRDMTMPTFDFDAEPGTRDSAGFLIPRRVKADYLGVTDPRIIASRVATALRDSGQDEAAREYLGQVSRSRSRDEVVRITMVYADPTFEDEGKGKRKE